MPRVNDTSIGERRPTFQARPREKPEQPSARFFAARHRTVGDPGHVRMSDPMSSTCIRCDVPRVAGPECSRCGVVYERAERRVATQRDGASVATGEPLLAPRLSAGAEFASRQRLVSTRAELQLARFAVPAAIVAWWVLIHTGMGGFFARTFSGMWLHELGHAVAAWLSGFPALPGPWVTAVGAER